MTENMYMVDVYYMDARIVNPLPAEPADVRRRRRVIVGDGQKAESSHRSRQRGTDNVFQDVERLFLSSRASAPCSHHCIHTDQCGRRL